MGPRENGRGTGLIRDECNPFGSVWRSVLMSQERNKVGLHDEDRSRVIEMAWEDRTPFEAIEAAYGLNESEVIELMRTSLKPSSFRLWRKRVSGRKTNRSLSKASSSFPICYRPNLGLTYLQRCRMR